MVLLSAQGMGVAAIARVAFPGGRGVVDDISHEGLRMLLREARELSTASRGERVKPG